MTEEEQTFDEQDEKSGKILMFVLGLLIILIAIICWAYWRGIVQ